MPQNRAVVALMMLVSFGYGISASHAAVVVLANRTDADVKITVSSATGSSRAYTIARGDVLALPLTRRADISYSSGGKEGRCRVELNEIYYFIGKAKEMQLKQIGLTGTGKEPQKTVADEDEALDRSAEKSPKVLVTIPVKILVDQTEPYVQNVWEKRLRQRLAAASEILERYCRVRFEVVETGTWESNEKLAKLAELMRDFRDKVTPGKARLAIGFTGLRPEKSEDHALGCTPAPLHTHILIREYKLKSESERLEVLVHEMGHFLGACHSPERDSVMRPKLGDGLANLRSYLMGFDPLNMLAMNLIAEEIANRPVRTMSALRARTRRRLIDIFAILVRAMPDDPAPSYYIRLLGPRPPELVKVRSLSPAVLEGARSVVSAITADAKRRESSPGRKGDALTSHYFRLAAEKCRQLPDEFAPTVYTLGLAIALDRTSLLRSLGLNGIPWSKIESDSERRQRLEVLGEPTMQGRESLTQSFVISAAVSMMMEGQAVSVTGLREELLLLQGGDKFRFDEMMASLAGITFATQLDASPDLLDELATSFRVSDYLMAPNRLPGPLDRDEFTRRFGSMMDERFLKPQDGLRLHLLALPGYQPRSARKEGMLPVFPSEKSRQFCWKSWNVGHHGLLASEVAGTRRRRLSFSTSCAANLASVNSAKTFAACLSCI
jgi:hypothetical protein